MITIQNNQRQRRILILDSAFGLEESNDFLRGMFDAVFIFTSSVDEAKAILNVINPVTSYKCCYKPFLLSRDLKGLMDDYDELVDAYTYDIDDAETLDTVDDIIRHIESIGLQADDSRVLSGNLFFIRLYRYLISRRIYNLTPKLDNLASMGYSIPIFELFYRQGAYSLNEYIIFNQSLLEKRYIRPVRFINKIYLCPQCLHSHLLYIESCPQCHSSDIKSEEVIHHFRCANISPEHTYNFGGQLRCPKCHHLLRHIGVDYDRPSVVYTCYNCEANFVQPSMTAVCTTCDNRVEVSGLTPYDVTASEITPEGCKAIVSPNIGFTVYTDFYDNYMEFDRFLARLRLLSHLKGAGGTDADIEIVKIWVLDEQEETCPLSPDFIALLCKRFPTHKVSSAHHMVYIRNSIYESDKESHLTGHELTDRLDAVLDKAATGIKAGERLCYAVSRYTDDIEEFTNSLHFTSPFPDKTFAFRQDEEGNAPAVVAETEDTPQTMIDASAEEVSLPPAGSAPSEITQEKKETQILQEPEEEKKPRDKKKSILIVSAILAVLLLLFIWLYLPPRQESEMLLPTSGEEEEWATFQDQQPLLDEPMQEEASTKEEPENIYPEEKAETPHASDVEITLKGMYYVVVGSYESKENALKQLQTESDKPYSYAYRLYKYGTYYVISPYSSTDRARCEEFVRAEGLSGRAWVTEGKKRKEDL